MPYTGGLELIQCAFCTKRYRFPGFYINHVQSQHSERVRYLPENELLGARYTLRDNIFYLPVYVDSDVESQRSDRPNEGEDEDLFLGHEETTIIPPNSENDAFNRAYDPGRTYGSRKDLDDDLINPYSPFSSKGDYELAHWFISNRVSKAAVNKYFRLDGISSEKLKSAHTLLKKVDQMSHGLDARSWQHGTVSFDIDDEIGRTETVDYFYRNPVEIVEFLFRQPCYQESTRYKPVLEFNEEGERLYSDIYNSNWIRDYQKTLPPGATVIALIGSSDQTHLTNYSGDKKLHPVYLSVGNIGTATRSKASMKCTVLVALLPIPPKHSHTGHGKTRRIEQQREQNRAVIRDVFHEIFRPLDAASQHGVDLLCPDGFTRRCYPKICTWVADYFENVFLHSIAYSRCPKCEAPESIYGVDKPQGGSGTARDPATYAEMMNEYLNGGGTPEENASVLEELKTRGVRPAEGVFWGLRCVDQMSLVVPDLLHTVYLGVLKHLMEWLVKWLNTEKLMATFDDFWCRVPAYHGLKNFNKRYTATSQWQGKEMKVVVKILVPILAATLLSVGSPISPHYAQVLKCVRSFVYFALMCEYRSHSDGTLDYMHRYLADFYATKDVFRAFRTTKTTKAGAVKLKEKLLQAREIQREDREDWDNLSDADKRRLQIEDEEAVADEVLGYTMDRSDFNFIKMHLLVHFGEAVRHFGSLVGLTAEYTEAAHKDLKNAFRHSNRNNASLQILKTVSRRDGFGYRELNVDYWHTLIEENCDPLRRILKRRVKGIKRCSQVAQAVGWDSEYLLDHVVRCMQRFQIWDFESLDLRDTEAVKRHLESLKWRQFAAVSVPYTKFQSTKSQEVHILRCTGTRLWRGKPPRNDYVYLYTGTLGLHELQSTHQRIPALLRCLFKIEDHENNRTALLAIVRSLKVDRYHTRLGVIQVSAPPESANQTISFGGGKTYIVPIRAIELPAHLIPLSLSSDNNRWLLNNCVTLETFNLLRTIF